LLPYHTFCRGGSTYVLNVERMTAARIEQDVAAALERLSSNADASVGPSVLERLNELGLVAGESEPPGPSATDGRSSVWSIALFVSQRCNLRCAYCYGDGGEFGRRGMMEETTALHAVDWLVEQSGDAKDLEINFFGGEPLLNFPLIQSTAEYAREKAQGAGKPLWLIVSTNGTVLDDEMIGFLREYDVAVNVSLDGPPGVQNRNRPFRDGSGSYDVVAANAKRLLSALPRKNVRCRSTLMGTADPACVAQTAEDLGFADWHLSEASPCVLAERTGKSGYDASAPRLGEAGRIAEARRIEAERMLAAVKNRDWDAMAGAECFGEFAGTLERLLLKRRKDFPCGAGRFYAGVSTSGDVFPCHRFVGLDEHKLGSVSDGHLDIGPFRQSPLAAVRQCSRCWAKHFCGGGCYYDHLARTGSMQTPSETEGICRQTKTGVEEAIHFWHELDASDREYVKYFHILRRGKGRMPFERWGRA